MKKETMRDAEVTYTLEKDGKFYIIENVPARVCEETGEQFFAPATVDRFGHRLHALQEVLGKLNDFRVQRSLLRQLEILRPSLPASKTESLLASRERSLTGQAAVAWSKVGARPRRWRREAARARG